VMFAGMTIGGGVSSSSFLCLMRASGSGLHVSFGNGKIQDDANGVAISHAGLEGLICSWITAYWVRAIAKCHRATSVSSRRSRQWPTRRRSPVAEPHHNTAKSIALSAILGPGRPQYADIREREGLSHRVGVRHGLRLSPHLQQQRALASHFQ
jgi:hypothetical protein